MVKLLYRVFTLPFFLDNITLFLIVIGLGGGFMSGREHIALAEFFISSSVLLLIPFLIWTLYAIKIVGYNAAKLKQQENNFLFSTLLFPRVKKALLIGIIIVTQFLPALLYGGFLMGIAKQYRQTSSLFQIAGSLIVLLLLMSLGFLYSLRHPNPDKRLSRITKLFHRSFRRPSYWFAFEWLTRTHPWTFIGAKVFSCLLLAGTLLLYQTDSYDYRLLGMAMAMISGIHAQLIYELHRFDNFHFAMMRQLPFSFGKRLVLLLVTLMLIWIPEGGVLLTYSPSSLPRPLQAISLLFAMSMNAALYGYLYRRDLGQEPMMWNVFLVTMALVAAILFKIPLWILATGGLLAALFWMNRYYYRFEYQSRP
jgi:hypothetical protein